MMIINLTAHPATPEQVAAGVFDLQGEALEGLKVLLTFDAPPSKDELRQRAIAICALAEDYHAAVPAAMIGGAPFFMGALETQLRRLGIQPLYAFSTRVVEEQTLPDGSIQKLAVFRHLGFVEA